MKITSIPATIVDVKTYIFGNTFAYRLELDKNIPVVNYTTDGITETTTTIVKFNKYKLLSTLIELVPNLSINDESLSMLKGANILLKCTKYEEGDRYYPSYDIEEIVTNNMIKHDIVNIVILEK